MRSWSGGETHGSCIPVTAESAMTATVSLWCCNRTSSASVHSGSQSGNCNQSESGFPSMRTWDEKVGIIHDWQDRVEERMAPVKVCAICGWCIPAIDVIDVEPTHINFSLLTNDCIPEYVLPLSYDREKYRNAILCPMGLQTPFDYDVLYVCSRCRSSLFVDKPRQPRFTLANFLYYGRERLLPLVADAFATASPFDLMLVSRAKGSVITHHYVCQSPHGGYVPEECSQHFNRGNVTIFPQDATHLRNVLPLTGDDIKDMICVVFSGGSGLPTADTLKWFKPVLVRKSRVQTVTVFLSLPINLVTFTTSTFSSTVQPVHLFPFIPCIASHSSTQPRA